DKNLRARITDSLGRLGEQSVATELVRLLSDPQLDEDLQGRIAEALGHLGERSVAPALIRLLPDPHLDSVVRGRIAEALGYLALDLPSIQMLTPLLLQPALANQVYSLLWKVSRSAGVSIFATAGEGETAYEVVPW